MTEESRNHASEEAREHSREELRDDLWGEIVRDFHEGQEALYAIRRADGPLEENNSPEVYFAEPDEFFPFEVEYLPEVKGPVLDIGSGPGRMMLWTQAEGLEVVGIESSPLTVAVARRGRFSSLHRSTFRPRKMQPIYACRK